MAKTRRRRVEDTVKRYKKAGLPASYTSARRLAKWLNRKEERVREDLLIEPSYTLHRPVVYKFQRRRVIVSCAFDQFQCDLVDVSGYSEENDGIRYLLCCIDVFSKYAWVRAVKDKKGQTVAVAMESILDAAERVPLYCQTDKGSEFKARQFQRTLKDRGIRHFVTENDDIKAQTVERFQRTLQDMIHRHFTATSSTKYVKVLPLLVKTYNATEHSTVKMSPSEAKLDVNTEKVWHNVYKHRDRKRPILKKGDIVRISKTRRQFAKGFTGHWSKELFAVKAVLNTTPVTYEIGEWKGGESISGTFYEKELQRVRPPKKVIKRR